MIDSTTKILIGIRLDSLEVESPLDLAVGNMDAMILF